MKYLIEYQVICSGKVEVEGTSIEEAESLFKQSNTTNLMNDWTGRSLTMKSICPITEDKICSECDAPQGVLCDIACPMSGFLGIKS